MDLEQRVKALEYEMKILKNEIQRTLLDIQEQVLVHYYPALRTEETGVPVAAMQAVEASRAQVSASTPPPAPVAAPALPAAPAEPANPVVKQVSLDEARNLARTPPPAAAVSGPNGDDATRMSKLLQWALDGSAKMGSEHLEALIKACGQKGILTNEMEQVLARITPLNRRAAPEVVGAGEIIRVMLELDAILGRAPDVEEALTLIEEAKIG